VLIDNNNRVEPFMQITLISLKGEFYEDEKCMFGGLFLWESTKGNPLTSKRLCTSGHFSFSKVFTRGSRLLLTFYTIPGLIKPTELVLEIRKTECMGLDLEPYKKVPVDDGVPLRFLTLTLSNMFALKRASYWVDLHKGMPPFGGNGARRSTPSASATTTPSSLNTTCSTNSSSR
jgi:hypothetical protein